MGGGLNYVKIDGTVSMCPLMAGGCLRQVVARTGFTVSSFTVFILLIAVFLYFVVEEYFGFSFLFIFFSVSSPP